VNPLKYGFEQKLDYEIECDGSDVRMLCSLCRKLGKDKALK